VLHLIDRKATKLGQIVEHLYELTGYDAHAQIAVMMQRLHAEFEGKIQ
jgi:hypothetical protein